MGKEKRKNLGWLVFIVILLLVPFIIIHIVLFRFEAYYPSDKLEDWGDYGSYLSGTLGFVIGIINAYLIYFTFSEQRKALAESKEETKIARNEARIAEFNSRFAIMKNDLSDKLKILESEDKYQKFIEYFEKEMTEKVMTENLRKRGLDPSYLFENSAFYIRIKKDGDLNSGKVFIRFRNIGVAEQSLVKLKAYPILFTNTVEISTDKQELSIQFNEELFEEDPKYDAPKVALSDEYLFGELLKIFIDIIKKGIHSDVVNSFILLHFIINQVLHIQDESNDHKRFYCNYLKSILNEKQMMGFLIFLFGYGIGDDTLSSLNNFNFINHFHSQKDNIFTHFNKYYRNKF